MNLRKVYIGETEVDFDYLQPGDKVLIRDPGAFWFGTVKSNPRPMKTDIRGEPATVLGVKFDVEYINKKI